MECCLFKKIDMNSQNINSTYRKKNMVKRFQQFYFLKQWNLSKKFNYKISIVNQHKMLKTLKNEIFSTPSVELEALVATLYNVAYYKCNESCTIWLFTFFFKDGHSQLITWTPNLKLKKIDLDGNINSLRISQYNKTL